ncbi:MAG: polyhydroxyalkanoic acid system family protein [Alphaproteobacteria bacterium]
MPQPLVVTIPHRLGKEEAVRRLKAGFAGLHTNFGSLLAVQEDIWTGDAMAFRVAVLGQSASGNVNVAEDHVRLEVQLPWLLGRLAERAMGMIQKQTTLMLEKK